MKRKKFIAIILAAFVATFGLASCGANKTNSDSDGKIKVVTTIFPQYDFAKSILGDKGDVTMLLKPGAESHSYEPTPKDIKMIQSADLFIYVGGENDVWVEDILKDMGKDAPKTLKLIDLVETEEEELVEGMEASHHHNHDEEEHDEHNGEEHEDHDGDHDGEDHHEHENEDEHQEIDEHVWTSPLNARIILKAISEEILNLKNISDADKELICKNTEAYDKKLENLDKEYINIVKNAKRKIVVFGDRFPFRYLAERYNLNYYAAFSGCSTETEAGAKTIKFLINKVKANKIPVVFSIEMSNKKIAKTICDGTGAKNLTLHSCHNLTGDELKNGETYISIMKKNAKALKEALK